MMYMKSYKTLSPIPIIYANTLCSMLPLCSQRHFSLPHYNVDTGMKLAVTGRIFYCNIMQRLSPIKTRLV